MENPTCTPEGLALVRDALELTRARQKVAWCLACGQLYPERYDGMLNTSVCKTCGEDAVVWGSPGARACHNDHTQKKVTTCDTN
jgi:hypothetical protein